MGLDAVDKGILYELQNNARDTTTSDIAEEVGVSASTVSNRIQRMEDQQIIRGYAPIIDYDKAGYPFHGIVACTAPLPSRHELAEEALEMAGITEIDLLMTGTDNFRVTAIGKSRQAIASVETGLHELDLRIESTWLLEQAFRQPFDHFGKSVTE